jgi:hypothetical protein
LRYRGFSGFLGQDERAHGFAGIPSLVEFLGGDDALWPHDFAVDAAHTHVRYACFAPHVAIGTADAQIDFAYRHGSALGTQQPLPDQLWLREGIEDQIAWCVERASHYDLAVAARLHF